MTSISKGATTITPTLIDGYKSTRPSRNILHTILGTEALAVSLRKAGFRKGTLRALFHVRADAVALEALLALDAIFTLTDPDEPTLNMTFVLDGELDAELDDETRDEWWVVFGYAEVPA